MSKIEKPRFVPGFFVAEGASLCEAGTRTRVDASPAYYGSINVLKGQLLKNGVEKIKKA